MFQESCEDSSIFVSGTVLPFGVLDVRRDVRFERDLGLLFDITSIQYRQAATIPDASRGLSIRSARGASIANTLDHEAVPKWVTALRRLGAGAAFGDHSSSAHPSIKP